jgi:hypothetical protein
LVLAPVVFDPGRNLISYPDFLFANFQHPESSKSRLPTEILSVVSRFSNPIPTFPLVRVRRKERNHIQYLLTGMACYMNWVWVHHHYRLCLSILLGQLCHNLLSSWGPIKHHRLLRFPENYEIFDYTTRLARSKESLPLLIFLNIF